MGRKNKIEAEVKLKAVRKILEGKASIGMTAESLSVHKSSVSAWVRNYRSLGEEAFLHIGNRKYSSDLKTEAVEYYLSGKDSLAGTCEKFGILSKLQLLNWIKKYNSHEELKSYSGGEGRIMTKGRKTTFEERTKIVSHCIENGCSYEKTAEKFGVSYQQVYTWVRKYRADGTDGLVDRRGKRKDESMLTDEEKLRAELKLKEAENERLRMENALLKKIREIERR